MKKWFVMGFFILLCGVACNSAMRDGVRLNADMPNTVKLPNGALVYNLSGMWHAVTKSSCGKTFNGTIAITQEGDLVMGSLQNGNYPVETYEMIRGTLKGAEIAEIKFNTRAGFIRSDGEILNSGKEMNISTELPTDNIRWDTTLTKEK